MSIWCIPLLSCVSFTNGIGVRSSSSFVFFDLLILFPALVLVAHIRHTFELKFNHTDVILLAIFSTDCLILGIKVCSYAV